jgi:quinoprotein glucose dehydrogenase
MVKHDVWDRDLPAPPSLVRVRRNGQVVDAVAQITKSGHVFVFDRQTGEPLFPVEYRAAPASRVDGEVLAGTQPFPVRPPPFARQVFTEHMATRRTPEAHRAVVQRLRTLRSEGQFAPPGPEGTVVFPGFDGGGEWGGAAFDPGSGLLYVNSNEMPWVLRLVERASPKRVSGRGVYKANCASCHREDLKGTPPEFPSLTGLGDKYAESEMAAVIRKGAGRMPGFGHLNSATVRAITRYVLYGEDTALEGKQGPSPIDLKYTHDGYNKFLDPDGYPAVEPPWGTLNAIDLNRGEITWKIPFGEFPELVVKGIRNTGSENYGGPVVTAGGLLFIGATNHDRKFRAFDKTSGKLLWETTLPAGGNATPAVYEVNGRQFVVIGAGGGKSGAPSGGSYVAFALGQTLTSSASAPEAYRTFGPIW